MGAVRLFLAIVVATNHWHLQVLEPHAFPWTDRALLGMNAGYAVMFFYVISGFLITYTLSRNYDPTWAGAADFYKARFVRIFSLYWPLALMAFLTVESAWSNFLAADLLDKTTGVLLIGMDWRIFLASYPSEHWAAALGGLHQAWTLGAEMTFYALAPLLMRSWKIGATLLCGSLSLRAGLLWYQGSNVSNGWTYLFAASTFGFFMLGHLSCLASCRFSVMTRRGWWAGLLFASVLVMEFAAREAFDTPRFWVSILLFAIALPGLFEATRHLVWLNFAGSLSYPVYLVHSMVLLWVADWVLFFVQLDPGRLASIVLAAAYGSVVLVAAAIAHLLIEKPMAGLMLRGFSGKGRIAGAAQSKIMQRS